MIGHWSWMPTPINRSSLPSLLTHFAHHTSPISNSLCCGSFIGAAQWPDHAFNTQLISVNKDNDSAKPPSSPHPQTTTFHLWPLILLTTDTFSTCLWTDFIVVIVCRPRGNVNTGQSYQHPHFFLRLLLSELFYAQGSHHFFFVETEVLIPLFSKSKKMSLKILCHGRGFITANFVIVEVFEAKFCTWVFVYNMPSIKKGKK